MSNNCCPKCKHDLPLATSLNSDATTPSEGDFSICINCGEILKFDNDLKSQYINTKDFLDLSDEHKTLLFKAQFQILKKSNFEKFIS